MASIYWVGGSGTWDATSVTHWANSSGGTGGTGSVPTNNDNVFFDQAGTYTVTMTGALNCSDITVSAGTVTFDTGTTPTLIVSGSMSIIAGTAWNSTGTITFNATTAKTISTNGITIDAPVTFNGVGGTWQLQNALTVGSARTTTLTNGTLNLNGYTFTTGLFNSSGSSARTIAFGTGNITVNGTGTIWTTATVTNLTTTGTQVVNVSNNTATAATVSTGALNEANSISFNFTTGTYALTFLSVSNYSARNVDFTGFAGTWNAISTSTIYGNLTISSGMTLPSSATNSLTFAATSGTKTITTNGKTLNFIVRFNGTGGTWQLQDALTLGPTNTTYLTKGTLNLNGYTLTTGTFTADPSFRSYLYIAGSTVYIRVDFNGSSNSIIVGTGTFSLIGTSCNFFGLGGDFSSITLNLGATNGQTKIYNYNYFKNITNTVSPTSVYFNNGTTTSFDNFSLRGSSGNLVTIGSISASSPYSTVSKTSGVVSCDYLNITRSVATGGAQWYAGSHSVDGGNNTGWIFSDPVTASGNMFLVF